MILKSLCKANQAILTQKVALLDALTKKYGADSVVALFTKICPIVGASIGQHYRHSMDHIELAALVAASASYSVGTPTRSASIAAKVNEDKEAVNNFPVPVTLHYDKRVRGGTLETDVDLTRARIQSVWRTLQEIQDDNDRLDRCNLGEELNVKENCSGDFLLCQPIKTSFLLSADGTNGTTDTEMVSTIGRELGFVVHHAIHHMAMVKIIAMKTLSLAAKDLPPDFGRAPSTTQYDNLKIDNPNK